MNFNKQNFAVKICKLLSNANRLKILDLLTQKHASSLTVGSIAEKLNLEMNLVSNQLIKLRENGILLAKQSGTNMFYEIKDQRVVEIIKTMQKLA